MYLSGYEKETIVNFNESEAEAGIYTHSTALRRQLDRLIEEGGEDCKRVKVLHDGQAAEYIIPKQWIKVRPPRKISEKQREALRKARIASQNAARAEKLEDKSA